MRHSDDRHDNLVLNQSQVRTELMVMSALSFGATAFDSQAQHPKWVRKSFAIAIKLCARRNYTVRPFLVYNCNSLAFLSLYRLPEEVSREYHYPVEIDAIA